MSNISGEVVSDKSTIDIGTGGAVSGSIGDLESEHQSQFVKEISKVTLPGGSTYNIKDEEARKSITIIGERISKGLPIKKMSSLDNNVTLSSDYYNFISLDGDFKNPINIPIPSDNTKSIEYHGCFSAGGSDIIKLDFKTDNILFLYSGELPEVTGYCDFTIRYCGNDYNSNIFIANFNNI